MTLGGVYELRLRFLTRSATVPLLSDRGERFKVDELFKGEALMRRLLFCLMLLPVLCGCASLRALIPGGVTAADAEWSGIKSGPTVSILASLDTRVAALGPLLTLTGQADPVGVLLPVTLVGETAPRWVLCSDKLVVKCNAIPLNARVNFAGLPIGPGILWRPSRLTAAGVND